MYCLFSNCYYLIAVNLITQHQQLLEAYRQALAAKDQPCCNRGCVGCNPRALRSKAHIGGAPIAELKRIHAEDIAAKEANANRKESELMARAEQNLPNDLPREELDLKN